MIRYSATPLFMTQGFFRSTIGYGPTGAADDYVERQTLDVDADNPECAAEKVWTVFQNIDGDRRCPDGGRSMAVGDLVVLTDPAGEQILLKAVACGFERTEFAPPMPGFAVLDIRNPEQLLAALAAYLGEEPPE